MQFAILGQTNDFVNIRYNPSTTKITCYFLNKQDDSDKNCSIMYGLNPWQLSSKTNKSSTTTIELVLEKSQCPGQLTCHYVITASNGSYTVRVEGTLDLSDPPSLGKIL